MNGVVFDEGKYTVPLTPKADTEGVRIRFKVFWKTQKFWNDDYIRQYKEEAPIIATQLKDHFLEWRSDGSINKRLTATCEDFAIRILVEFAFRNNLPIKITTNAGVFRNMEPLDQSDDTLPNVYGFMQKVMRSCAAQDMLNDRNTRQVHNEQVEPGDLLVQLNSQGGARHVQITTQNTGKSIIVIQGNQEYKYHYRALYWIAKKLTGNKSNSVSDPNAKGYEGMSLGEGEFSKNREKWAYKNLKTGFTSPDFLRQFVGRSWNFSEFNK